jgi:predicted secreted protein
LWWLSFLAVLPLGAQSFAEAGEEPDPGSERAAPKRPRLAFKAMLASGIAAVIWLLVAWAVAADVLGLKAY